ncbi:MAG: aminotransferase class V-fold PLP-dependent enzyme [Planctomycetota bacterium]
MSNEIYLNHAGTSWPKPMAVRTAVDEAMHCSPSEWSSRFERAHRNIADFLGVRDHEQLLLTPGCTSALAVGLGDVDLGGRRRVLTSCWEHHALHRPLIKRAEAGLIVETIPACENEPLPLETLEQLLSAGDVGLVAITAASNVTGDRLPITEAIGLAHRYGAQVMIDAAQVVGWIDLDCDSLGADLVAFGGHKGLQGPWGIGGLYVSSTARMTCASATCGVESRDSARPGYCDVGSVDQVALAGLDAAVGWLRGLDAEANQLRALNQIVRIESELRRIDGVRLYGATADRRMPSLAFTVDGFSSTRVAKELAAVGVTVGSGFQCSPLGHTTLETDTDGVVRLSVGVDQADGEIDAAIDRVVETITAIDCS